MQSKKIDSELRSQFHYNRNKDNKENVKLINEKTTMEVNTTISEEQKKKISLTGMRARALVGLIEEVTDPELRSQLAYYRKRDKQAQQKESL